MQSLAHRERRGFAGGLRRGCGAQSSLERSGTPERSAHRGLPTVLEAGGQSPRAPRADPTRPVALGRAEHGPPGHQPHRGDGDGGLEDGRDLPAVPDRETRTYGRPRPSWRARPLLRLCPLRLRRPRQPPVPRISRDDASREFRGGNWQSPERREVRLVASFSLAVTRPRVRIPSAPPHNPLLRPAMDHQDPGQSSPEFSNSARSLPGTLTR
jgi:hypothetical protein